MFYGGIVSLTGNILFRLMNVTHLASLLNCTAVQHSAAKWPRVHALALGALLASSQTWNVDLQVCVAVQLWNQTASVILRFNPLLVHALPPPVAGAAASLLGLACLSLPEQS